MDILECGNYVILYRNCETFSPNKGLNFVVDSKAKNTETDTN